MTSITNRQDLLTLKVQHYSSQYLKTIASYYFKENNNFNYLLSSQDTKLSATSKLSNKIKHATYRKFNLRQKKSSRKTKALQLNRAPAKKKKNNSQLKEKHANPMRSSSSSGACISPTQMRNLVSNLLLHQRKQNKHRKVKSETLQA